MDNVNSAPKHRILLVEYDRDVASVIYLALEDFFEVAMAETAQAAIRTLHAAPVDLILLDWRLGENSGQEVLDELEMLHGARPHVVITSGGDDEELCRAVRAGKAKQLPKPFGIEDLVRTVTRMLNKRPGSRADTDHLTKPVL